MLHVRMMVLSLTSAIFAFGCAARQDRVTVSSSASELSGSSSGTTVNIRPIERSSTRPTTASIAAVSHSSAPRRGATDAAPLLSTEGSANLASARDLVGQRCRVKFRRDALGMTGPSHAEPAADTVGGKPLYIDGLLERITPDAVLLHNGERIIWIPSGNVLLIETAPDK